MAWNVLSLAIFLGTADILDAASNSLTKSIVSHLGNDELKSFWSETAIKWRQTSEFPD